MIMIMRNVSCQLMYNGILMSLKFHIFSYFFMIGNIKIGVQGVVNMHEQHVGGKELIDFIDSCFDFRLKCRLKITVNDLMLRWWISSGCMNNWMHDEYYLKMVIKFDRFLKKD